MKKHIIDKTLKDFEKKHPIRAFIIRLKIKIMFYWFHIIKRK